MTEINKNKLVTTYSGKTVKRCLCKKIKNVFYIVGNPSIKGSGECYLVDGQYTRDCNGLIEYDYESKLYVLVHKNHLKFGVVDIDDDGNKIQGYFTPNLTENVILGNITDSNDNTQCISEDIAKKLNFREKLSNGIFYDRSSKNVNFFKKITSANINKRNLPYDSRYASTITETQYKTNYKPNYNIESLNTLGDFLDKSGITFGIEFETSSGFIPDRLCYKYGLIPLRDGSISGIEYVTVPYSGTKGLYALKNVCLELGKRTKFDNTCALHLHLGGLNRDNKSIFSSYVLAHLLQDEFFEMQPNFKKGGVSKGDLERKDYCSPLDTKLFKSLNFDNIKDSDKLIIEFKKFFKFVSDGVEFKTYDNDINKINSHPSDPSGNHKWQIRSRYKWLNFVPIVFGNKKTLEFRHHSITFNFEKVINFLFTCSCFIKVSNDFSDEILDYNSKFHKSLYDSENGISIITKKVIDNDKSLSNIKDRNDIYNKIRKNIMSKLNSAGDNTGDSEITYDSMISEKLKPLYWDE